MKIDNRSLFVLIISIFLFIIGFIFNEDSSGGGKLDFELHEWGNFLKFKSGIINSLTSIEYESSRMPLFLIINAFNPFDFNQYFYRLEVLKNLVKMMQLFLPQFLCSVPILEPPLIGHIKKIFLFYFFFYLYFSLITLN